MYKRENLFKFLLRMGGAVSLLAFFAIFMPYSWMNSAHKWLGMGELPAEPVIGYLARSTSAFYAFFGGLLLVVSCDVRKYWTVLIYIGTTHVVFGLMLLVVDFLEGLPLFWAVSEGPIAAVFGGIILFFSFNKGIRPEKLL